MKSYWVYIITNKKQGTLYIGVTSNLVQRIFQHKNKVFEGFSKKYDLTQLVYFEESNEINLAISREKQIKKWNRGWKIELIEKNNPDWQDLFTGFVS